MSVKFGIILVFVTIYICLYNMLVINLYLIYVKKNCRIILAFCRTMRKLPEIAKKVIFIILKENFLRP